jgi:HD-like signal output (HDOD) protein
MTRPSPKARPDDRVEAQLVEHLESGALEVPILPEVAATVIGERDEDLDFRAVSDQIHRDQALAGHVLRVANSAAISGRASRIVSLQQALVRLGARRVKELVLAVVMKTRIFRSHRHAARAQAIWREAAATACLAREIARAKGSNPETAFLAGLLRTIGKPVVLEALSEHERGRGVALPAELVDRLIAAHHVDAGLRLAAAWALPPSVGAAIAHAEAPGAAPEHRELVAVVAAAARLAPRLLAGEEPETLAEVPELRDLRLPPGEAARIVGVRDRLHGFVEAFG